MFTTIFFLSHFFPFDDESDNDSSGSGSSGTCYFSSFSRNYVGRASGIFSVGRVSGIFSVGRVS